MAKPKKKMKAKKLTLTQAKRDQAALTIGEIGREAQRKAAEATGEAQVVLTTLSNSTLALSRDLVRKRLSFSDYTAFVRKAKLTADSGLQRIAERKAKDYMRSVVEMVTGGLLKVFG